MSGNRRAFSPVVPKGEAGDGGGRRLAVGVRSVAQQKAGPLVDVVVPVYNEERDLPWSMLCLRQFLAESFPYSWRVVVADNGSTDQTLAIAEMLAQKYSDVACIHLPQKGRGRALKKAWLESPADIVTYMDVDLSTDLDAFLPLVDAIVRDGYDVAIGSRLRRESQTTRSWKRTALSRGYNLMIKAMFFTRISDAQCGFKAISRAAAQVLLPLVKDDYFFLDTELLLIAEKRGFRIKEVPVKWIEDPDSRVNISRTVRQDIAGLLRLRFGGIPRPASLAEAEPRRTS
ncbi:MAG: glycosyltransferase family 2 protein [Chloroflexi bacterium]|nr:glycosyltransferase family 2 protein [Chloroflexota bacterium]